MQHRATICQDSAVHAHQVYSVRPILSLLIHLKFKIMLESSPLKSSILARRLAATCTGLKEKLVPFVYVLFTLLIMFIMMHLTGLQEELLQPLLRHARALLLAALHA